MAALVVAALGQPVALLSRPADVQTIPPLPTVTSPQPSATTPQPTATATADPLRPLAGARRPRPDHPRAGGARGRPRPASSSSGRCCGDGRTSSSTRSLTSPSRSCRSSCSTAARRTVARTSSTGAPRNAIVAAWLDLETSAAATGLPRLPAETSTEYTERVIGAWPVDRERLGDLAALYREARFSVHELGESHRDRAISDLRVLHRRPRAGRHPAGGRAGPDSRPSRRPREPRGGRGRDQLAGRHTSTERAPS